MALRYLTAALILLVLFRKLVISRDSIIAAALVSASTLCWIIGLQYVSIGDSAVLSYTAPLFSVVLAFVFIKERPKARGIVGSVVGFIGVVVYSTTLYSGFHLIGAILTALNALFWAGFTIYLRRMRDLDPAGVVSSQFLFASVPFVVGSMFYPSVHFTPEYVFDVAYTGVLGGAVAWSLWNAMLSVEKVGKVTTMAYGIPATTIALQSVITLRLPLPISILGAVIMFIGIYISYGEKEEHQTFERRKESETQHERSAASWRKRWQIFRESYADLPDNAIGLSFPLETICRTWVQLGHTINLVRSPSTAFLTQGFRISGCMR